MTNTQEIQLLCSKLRLGSVIPELSKDLDDASLRVLCDALRATLAQRDTATFLRRVKKSGLNADQTFESYEFGRFAFPVRVPQDDFLRLDFVRRRENVIMFGAPGTGKTHLANATGIEACRQRLPVLFDNTSSFVARLVDAHRCNRQTELMRQINKVELLILDEFGYVPIDTIGAQLLFRVIGDFYEHKSIIITTNLLFSEWSQIFIDPKLTDAIVDRMVHHSHMIRFDCESWRVKHSLMIY